LNSDLKTGFEHVGSANGLQQFMADFTRMKQKINSLIVKAKESDNRVE
jgi:hypothetical protein